MLFVIFVAILIAGRCLLATNKFDAISVPAVVVGAITVVISLFIIGVNHIGVDASIDKMEVRRDALVYQYENEIYENDNDLGKRALMTDIQAWNEDLAYGKKIHDNFWVGIYWADYYTMFDPIELKE